MSFVIYFQFSHMSGNSIEDTYVRDDVVMLQLASQNKAQVLACKVVPSTSKERSFFSNTASHAIVSFVSYDMAFSSLIIYNFNLVKRLLTSV